MAKGIKDPDLDRGLPPRTPVSWAMSRSSLGVTPETSMVTYSTFPTASSAIASWFRGRRRRPTPAPSLRCRIITGRKFYSDFNTVFVPLLLLAAGVGFPAACF